MLEPCAVKQRTDPPRHPPGSSLTTTQAYDRTTPRTEPTSGAVTSTTRGSHRPYRFHSARRPGDSGPCICGRTSASSSARGDGGRVILHHLTELFERNFSVAIKIDIACPAPAPRRPVGREPKRTATRKATRSRAGNANKRQGEGEKQMHRKMSPTPACRERVLH